MSIAMTEIDDVLAAMNGHEACGRVEELENIIWLSDLVRALTGLNEYGEFNPDVARESRHHAGAWLRQMGQIKP